MSLNCFCGLVAAAVLSWSGVAGAQCPDRWFASGWSIGQVADVQAACVWDPDGSGPAPDLLVVGGDFHLAGGAPVDYVAAWDGAAWGPLGQALDGPVTGLATYGGVLFASSSRYGVTSTIYRFNGASWVADTHHAGQVLGVYAGKLITGAYPNSWTWWAWDGAAWSAVPAGYCGISAGEYQGQLVSTEFMFYTPCVSRFDGNAWIDIGSGLTCVPQFGLATAILGIGGDLYIGGTFCVQACYGVGHWDGAAWQPMGTGAGVYAWLNHNGSVVAAGSIPVAGGSTPLALWNGQAWEALVTPWVSGPHPAPHVMCEFRGDIVLGGQFAAINGQTFNSIARWDGAALQPLGAGPDLASGGTVRALYAEGPDLYVGGHFTTVGGLACGSVAHFNGAAWDNMGGGLGYVDPHLGAAPLVIARFGGELIFGGVFDLAGGAAARNIAAWDGTRWRSLGAGLGFTVQALAEYQGLLYAGGTSSIAVPSGLARWNGSAWETVPTPSSGNVDALIVYNGELCVGGPGINVPGGGNGLGRWDGSQWLPVGTSGQSISARRLAVYNGELIIATSSADLRSILRWSGQGLLPLGLGPPHSAQAFAVANGELLAAGSFSSAGTGPANNVAIWDGATWRALGLGLQGGASAAVAYAGGVEVGGDFSLAGGEISPALARWGPGAPICYANCDCSNNGPVLNVLDFVCFLNRFAAGDIRANCDGSTSAPALNVLDFGCLLNRFAAGCP